MRRHLTLLGSMLLLCVPAMADVSESEKAELLGRMTDQQRMMYDSLPPATQTRVLETMKAKMGTSTRSTPEKRLETLPPEQRRAVDAAVAERAREADGEEYIPSWATNDEPVENRQETEQTCRKYRQGDYYDDRLDRLCDDFEDRVELERGHNVTEQKCDEYEDEVREVMCWNYERQLASYQAGGSSDGSGAEAAALQRQAQAGAFGIQMMMRACNCDEFE